ncbi:MAG: ABC transporter ATP-binding protein [Desulfovibrionaceae bacterium]
MSSAGDAISVENLHYSYPDGMQALRGVTFRISTGECVALVGANSAGKSTLLLHLNGCLLPPPKTVYIMGQEVNTRSVQAIRQHLGTVFQEPDDQLFMPTIGEDVAFGPLNLDLPAEVVDARVSWALNATGCVHLQHRPPYRCSGGEKRAAAIATVLSMEPDILLLDEPTSNLDPRARRQFIALIRTLPHTKLIATHDIALVQDICPRTIVMFAGQIQADGPTEAIFADAALLDACHL